MTILPNHHDCTNLPRTRISQTAQLTSAETSDARGGVDIIPVPGAANNTDADVEQSVNKDEQERRWREILRPFSSNDGHMWTITEETREAQYEWNGSSHEGYRTFKGTCRSLTHECGVGTCELQIWYQYEFAFQLVTYKAYVTNSPRVKPSAVTGFDYMSDSESTGQEESDEEGKADSPKGKETSYPPLRLYPIPPRPTEQLDSEIVDMLDVLEILTLGECKYTPQLLDRLSAKTRHDTLDKKAFRGGYQELAVTSIVPGEPLTDQLLRGISAEDRDILRQHLKETITYATSL